MLVRVRSRLRARSRGNTLFIAEYNGLCPISSHWHPLDSPMSHKQLTRTDSCGNRTASVNTEYSCDNFMVRGADR